MPEAVVDHLEPVEVEVEHRESAATPHALELGEPAPESFDENRAVAEAGQRIEEPGIAQPFLRNRLLGRVGQRPGDPDRAAAGASHGHSAAEEPPVGAVLVTDSMLVLKVIGGPGERRFQCRLEVGRVIRMDAFRPLVGTAGTGIRRQAEHCTPPAREIELLRPKVPFPQSVVRPFRRQRQPLFAAFECVLGVRPLGDVMPQQRDSAGHRKDSDLQHARSRRRCQSDMRERSRIPIGQGFSDRPRELGPPQRGNGRDHRVVQRAVTGTIEDAFERVVPEGDESIAVDDRHALIQSVDHFAASLLLFLLIQLRAVRAVGEKQRDDGDRQHFPHLIVDHLHEADGEARTNEVARTAL